MLQVVRPMLGLAVSLCLTFILGCGGEAGPKRYQVSGTVTLNGARLETGIITLLDDKTGGDGGEIHGGKFSMESTPGSKRVTISASKTTDKPVEGKQGLGIMQSESLIPGKYNRNTELKADVFADKPNNALKFDLTTTPADFAADAAAAKAGGSSKGSSGKK